MMWSVHFGDVRFDNGVYLVRRPERQRIDWWEDPITMPYLTSSFASDYTDEVSLCEIERLLDFH